MAERYEICIQGHMDARWATYFDNMQLSHRPDGTTLLAGPIADQPALLGLLTRIGSLGLPILTVKNVEYFFASGEDEENLMSTITYQPAGGSTMWHAMAAAVREYWDAARGYQKFLYLCGGLFLLSAVFHTGVWILTAGSLQGDVSWRKPIIFAEAFGVTCLSLAWVMTFLSKRRVLGWSLSIVLGVASIAEVFLITMQQWRGVPSHFNTSTPFDSTVFGLMGLSVLFVEVVIFVMTVWTLLPMDAPSSLKWSIRAGMLLLVAAQIFGNLIIQNGSNTFGAAGAMKIPHALSLHGLQILPLIAWLLLFTNVAPSRRNWLVALGIVGYTGLVIVSAFQTFRGLAPFDFSVGPALLFGASLLAFAVAGLMTCWSLLADSLLNTRVTL